MYKGKKILALIPARGGSKGLPGKNIKPLFGKPLIGWTIEQALRSRLLDRVVVSTDDKAIAETAVKYGAEVPCLRPPGLARDNSRVVDVVLHVLDLFEKRGEKYDYLLLLEPTSPLRKKGDIDRAVRTLVDAGARADSLVSVGEIALEHPAYAKTIGRNKFIKPYCPDISSAGNRQGLAKAYFPYGVVYLSKVPFIRKRGQVYGGKILPLFIERWQNYEINDALDLKCVETIFKEMREHI
jgi:CMP-N-acetylneuraminic acid synthetase